MNVKEPETIQNPERAETWEAAATLTKENGDDPCQNGSKSPLNLTKEDYLQLHIQEYIALRSEQRTRLDSANKIINYYAIVIAATVASLLSLYKEGGGAFNQVFPIVLLLLPLITLPFAFTQQNEEILVRSIGSYLREIKGKITELDDKQYWSWERYHISTILEHQSLLVTSMFRASLLLLFSILSLVVYIVNYGITSTFRIAFSPELYYRSLMLWIDGILLYLAFRVNIGMIRVRKDEFYRLKGDKSNPIAEFVTVIWRIGRWLVFLEEKSKPKN